MAVTFRTESHKLVAALHNGVFVCWLERCYRKRPGIMPTGYTYWTARIGGKDISCPTLAGAKAKIIASVGEVGR